MSIAWWVGLIAAYLVPVLIGLVWLGRLAQARQARLDLKVRDRKAYLFEARKAFEQGSPEWHMLDSAIKDLK